ncbi:hypothetical protein HDV05_005412 [Chytridiales sp. JEL 0842]|nr:hypothetical protein HDV05_005412 [Chytridiales sp. JEL 0842]
MLSSTSARLPSKSTYLPSLKWDAQNPFRSQRFKLAYRDLHARGPVRDSREDFIDMSTLEKESTERSSRKSKLVEMTFEQLKQVLIETHRRINRLEGISPDDVGRLALAWAGYEYVRSHETSRLSELTRRDIDVLLTAARQGTRFVPPKLRLERTRTVLADALEWCKLDMGVRGIHAQISAHRGLDDPFEFVTGLIEDAKGRGLVLTRGTYNLLVDAYARQFGVSKALKYLEENEELWEVAPTFDNTDPADPTAPVPFRRSTTLYNLLVSVLISQRKVGEALSVIDGMREKDIRPDAVTWSILINGYVKRQDMDSAIKCFEAMKNSGCKPSRMTYELLICGFLRRTAFQRPRGEEKDPQYQADKLPSSGSHKLQELEMSMVQKGFTLYNEMLEAGLQPGIITYDILMNAHCRRGEHERVKELFQTLLADGLMPDMRLYSVLLRSTVALREFKEAREILSKLVESGFTPDVVVYSILMNGYAHLGDIGSVMEIYDEMIANNVEPTLVTYGIVLNALCIHRDMPRARLFLDEIISKGYRPNLIIYNTLLNGYGLAGDLRSVRNTYNEMLRRALVPGVTTYNILMAAHVRAGDVKGAMDWYDVMVRSFVEPTLVTFNILINAHAKQLNAMGAVDVFESMEAKGFSPDDASITPIIDSFAQRKEWAAAREWVAFMRERGAQKGGMGHVEALEKGVVAHRPVSAHNIIIKALMKSGNVKQSLAEAEMVALESGHQNQDLGFQDISTPAASTTPPPPPTTTSYTKGAVEADIRTYDMIIRALGYQEDLEGARRWFDQAIANGIKPDTRLYNALMVGYLKKADSQGMMRINKEMEAQGLTPDFFSYTMIFQAKCRSSNMKELQEDGFEVAGAIGGDEDDIVGEDEKVGSIYTSIDAVLDEKVDTIVDHAIDVNVDDIVGHDGMEKLEMEDVGANVGESALTQTQIRAAGPIASPGGPSLQSSGV